MLCWLLYLSKATIFQILLYCLSQVSSTASRLSVSALSPPRLSHLSSQITLCQIRKIISHPNPLNQQWHFLRCGCIFRVQELPVSPLHKLCHLHQFYLPSSLLFSLNVPDCPISASSLPRVTAAKPSSLPIFLAGSSVTSFYLFHQTKSPCPHYPQSELHCSCLPLNSLLIFSQINGVHYDHLA